MTVFRKVVVCVALACLVASLAACTSSSSDSGPVPAINAVGGNGTFGTGGDGGGLYTESTGNVTVATSGSVDASFTPSDAVAVSFGTNTYTVSVGTTTVELVTDLTTTYAVGTLCTPTTDVRLYLITDSTNTCGVLATMVTGIVVPVDGGFSAFSGV